MIEVLGEKYILAARVKGLSKWKVIRKHAFRNIAVQLLTVVALAYAILLEGAVVSATLAEAVADCTLVIGTSARSRRIQVPQLHPRELGRLCADSPRDEIAIVFGREDSGLNNEELQRCHYHVHIPTSAAYTSMNLAQAVQVLCYELHMALSDPGLPPAVANAGEPADQAEVDRLIDHLERAARERAPGGRRREGDEGGPEEADRGPGVKGGREHGQESHRPNGEKGKKCRPPAGIEEKADTLPESEIGQRHEGKDQDNAGGDVPA